MNEALAKFVERYGSKHVLPEPCEVQPGRYEVRYLRTSMPTAEIQCVTVVINDQGIIVE